MNADGTNPVRLTNDPGTMPPGLVARREQARVHARGL